MQYINISKDGKILDEKFTSKTEDTVVVNIDVHTKEEKENYTAIWIDQFGNKTEKKITVSYNIPDISIIEVSPNADGQTVAITAELSQDIDKGDVLFQRKRWDARKTMRTKDVKSANIPVVPWTTTIIWSPFSVGTNIAMYDKNDEIIALMNPETAEILIQTGYNELYDIKVLVQESAILQLYNKDSQISTFSISLPTKECVKVDAPNYVIVNLSENGIMWMFNGWKAVYQDGNIVLLISPTGYLYSELWLEWNYTYDREVWAIELTLYQPSDFTKSNPIRVRLTVNSFVGK